jgi:hypothetical protein
MWHARSIDTGRLASWRRLRPTRIGVLTGFHGR